MTSLEKLEDVLKDIEKRYGNETVVMRISTNTYIDTEEQEEDNENCPVCDKPNSGGVPCSWDCFKADMR